MEDKLYPITSLHKDDIRSVFEDDKDYKKINTKINKLSDVEMKWLARKLADSFCNCCYWTTVKIYAEELFKRK